MDGMAFGQRTKRKIRRLRKQSQPTIALECLWWIVSIKRTYPSTTSLWIESYAQLESLIREASQKNLEAEKTEKRMEHKIMKMWWAGRYWRNKICILFKENYTIFRRNHIQETYPNATTVHLILSSTGYERNEEIEQDLLCMILASALMFHKTINILQNVLAFTTEFSPSRPRQHEQM